MSKREIIKRPLIEVLNDLPEVCYSRNPTDGSPVILKRGVVGYWPAKPNSKVEELNETLGVTVAQEEAMIAGSFCGFNVPGADPLNYADPTMNAKLEAKRAESKAKYVTEAA